MAEHISVRPFWKTKSMEEMDKQEWESLCDGCARCCLEKLEDEDTEEIHFTHLVCRYLDQEKCSCTDYKNRAVLVPHCVELTPQNVLEYKWLPNTCAYRLVAEGKDLPDWHPLITGTHDSVLEAGIAVTGKCISEEFVEFEDWQDHIITWASCD